MKKLSFGVILMMSFFTFWMSYGKSYQNQLQRPRQSAKEAVEKNVGDLNETAEKLDLLRNLKMFCWWKSVCKFVISQDVLFFDCFWPSAGL